MADSLPKAVAERVLAGLPHHGVKRLGLASTLMLVLLAAAPAPAGNDGHGCGLPAVRDPEIRAAFERFERSQSAGATMICDIYLNNFRRASRTP